MEETAKKRVCVIGAGPRALVTARHLSEIPNLEISLFEAKEDLGGLWFFKNDKTPSELVDPSKVDNFYRLYKCHQDSMYETLITNLPYFFMEFKDLGMLDVDPNLPTFITINQYKKYLDAYADKFELRKFITFNTLIKAIRLSKNLSPEEKKHIQGDKKFVVKTVNAKGSSLESDECYHEFDYVIVTSGQYSYPYIPKVPGDENYKGNVVHYKNFGSPNSEIYQGKRVLLVGGSEGSCDILIQFFANDIKRIKDCEKVILCSRRVSHVRSSEDFKEIVESGRLALHEGSIKEFKGDKTVCFSDGTEEEVDTIIFATGYKLKFPYMDQETDKIIDHNEAENRGGFFGPLFRKLVSVRESGIYFIGYLETTLLVNILPELQAIAVKNILQGKLELPSQEKMQEEFDEEVNFHMKHFGDLSHFYKTDLAAQFPGLPNKDEHTEWVIFRKWLGTVYPESNERKADQFFNYIMAAKKAFVDFKRDGNYLQYKKYDYHLVYPKEFRNTTEFV